MKNARVPADMPTTSVGRRGDPYRTELIVMRAGSGEPPAQASWIRVAGGQLVAGSGTAERAGDFRAITADRSAAVGRHVTAAKPASCSIRVSSLVDQHLPGVECIRNTEYSAAGSGPVLVAFMCTSWSTRNPPGGSAA